MADETSTELREGYVPGYQERVHQRLAQRHTDALAGFFLSYLRPGIRLLDAGFARAEGHARAESFGTPEAVHRFGTFIAGQLDEAFRPTVLAEGWADAAQVDAMVAELRAWAERPGSFGCGLLCAAVGWVDA